MSFKRSARSVVMLFFYSSLFLAVVFQGVDLNWVFFVWFLVGLAVICPLMVGEDILHPLSISAGLLFLPVLDFAIKESMGAGLRYFPLMDKAQVSDLRLYALIVIGIWACLVYFFFAFAMRIYSVRIVGGEDSCKYHLSKLKRFDRLSVNVLIWFSLGMSVASFCLVLLYMGGIGAILAAMSDRSEAYMGVGFLRSFAQFGVVGAIGFLIVGRVGWSILALMVAFFSTLIFGGRGAAALGVLLPYIFSYNMLHKKISSSVLYFYGAAGVLFVFSMQYLKFSGRELVFSFVNVASSIGSGMADILPSMFYALDQGILDYQYGRTLLNVFFVLIPRLLWPEKPEGLGEDAILGRALIGEYYWGLPPGAYGVAYLNFSLFGVFLLAPIVGFLSGWLFSKYLRSIELVSPLLLMLYPIIFVKVFYFFSVYAVLQVLVLVGLAYFAWFLSAVIVGIYIRLFGS